jgi:hypothetical protein
LEARILELTKNIGSKQIDISTTLVANNNTETIISATK